MGFLVSTLLPVALYLGVASTSSQSVTPYTPAATFSILLVAVQSGIGNWLSYGMLLPPVALAVHLYMNVYPQKAPASPMVPPMANEYVYYPSIAGASALVATSMASSVGLPFLQCSPAAAYGLMAVHIVRSLFFAIGCLIYPAPIVSQFLIGEQQLSALREPIKDKIHSLNIHKTLGDENSTILGQVEYAVFERPTQGRNLATGARVFEKQWVIYIGGNGEVMEATYNSPLSLANSLNANLLVLNPRGVGRSTGRISSAADLIHDARSVIQKIRKQYSIDDRKVLLFGHSIGGGIAAHLANEELKEASVIFDRTFSSLTDAALHLSPIKHDGLVRFLLPHAFGDFDVIENYKKISHDRKLILFHRKDQIIRFEGISLARLGASALGGEQHMLELVGEQRGEDPHNCAFTSFRNHADVLSRIKKILHV